MLISIFDNTLQKPEADWLYQFAFGHRFGNILVLESGDCKIPTTLIDAGVSADTISLYDSSEIGGMVLSHISGEDMAEDIFRHRVDMFRDNIEIPYFANLVADSERNEADNIEELRASLDSLRSKLGECHVVTDQTSAIAESLAGDALVIAFSGEAPMPVESLGTVIRLQNAEFGGCHMPYVVYARQHAGKVTYIGSNHDIGKGTVKVQRSEPQSIPIPLMDEDHEVTMKSDIRVVPLKDTKVLAAYIDILRHRLSSSVSTPCALVLIDGAVAGILTYGINPNFADNSVLLRQAFGTPHKHLRIAKLITMIALMKSTAQLCSNSHTCVYIDSSDKVHTAIFSRYPEAKGLRGLMKITRRVKDEHGEYNITYTSPWRKEIGLKNTLSQFLSKEHKNG